MAQISPVIQKGLGFLNLLGKAAPPAGAVGGVQGLELIGLGMSVMAWDKSSKESWCTIQGLECRWANQQNFPFMLKEPQEVYVE